MDGAQPIHLTNGDYFYRGWRDVPRAVLAGSFGIDPCVYRDEDGAYHLGHRLLSLAAHVAAGAERAPGQNSDRKAIRNQLSVVLVAGSALRIGVDILKQEFGRGRVLQRQTRLTQDTTCEKLPFPSPCEISKIELMEVLLT